MSRLHTEIHAAEVNIKAMEDEVSDELSSAIKQAWREVKKTEKAVENTQDKIEETQKEVKATEKEVKSMENELDEDIKKTVRWKRKIF